MTLVALVAMLALLQLIYFSFNVGGARGKHDVAAPATAGPEEFNRIYRVHQNTLEQIVALIPGLFVFATYVHELGAAGLGVVYIVGRFVYASAYVKDPASRSTGMLMSFIPILILVIGGGVGAALTML